MPPPKGSQKRRAKENFLLSFMSKPPPTVMAKALLEKLVPLQAVLLLQLSEMRAPPKLSSKNGRNGLLFRMVIRGPEQKGKFIPCNLVGQTGVGREEAEYLAPTQVSRQAEHAC